MEVEAHTPRPAFEGPPMLAHRSCVAQERSPASEPLTNTAQEATGAPGCKGGAVGDCEDGCEGGSFRSRRRESSGCAGSGCGSSGFKGGGCRGDVCCVHRTWTAGLNATILVSVLSGGMLITVCCVMKATRQTFEAEPV